MPASFSSKIEPLEARIAPAFAPVFELSSLNGINGFKIDGAAAHDRSGRVLSDAGDVNGDGFGDLLIGAPGAYGFDPGASYVVFGNGNPFSSSLDLSALNGVNGFKISGEAPGDNFGISVSTAGDVNGDGFDDLFIGSLLTTSGDLRGTSYVVFGQGPSVSIGHAAAVEGMSGATALNFTVSHTHAITQPITVDFSTVDGTAIAGSDFTPLSHLQITIGPGETSKIITIDLLGDAAIEGDEAFSVVLSHPTNATLATSTAVGTILNDDTTVRITDVEIVEDDAGSSALTFGVNLEAASAVPVTVNVAAESGTAVAGSDFVALAPETQVTFAPGETTKTISIEVIGDAVIEPHEIFSVVLSNPINATIAGALATGTILNDDTSLRVDDASLLEGHAGGRGMIVTIALNGESALPVSVNFATADGTAIAGTDYTPLSGTLHFLPGEVSKTVNVNLLGDIAAELNETFSVLLSDPVNAVLADEQGAATILDDDVTLASSRKATFTDVDGENVTIKVSKGTLKVEDFTIFPSGLGAQLALVDFSGESEFAGANLTITSKAPRGVAAGDRVAHVGHINATGIDLGKVRISGVLGQIDAGDALTPKRGVASLSAQSIGRSGLLTQLPGGSLQSDIDGALKTLRLADGIHDASLVVNGPIDTIDITGGVIGSAIRSGEAIGAIRISGDLAADATITARGRLDPPSTSRSVAIGSIAIGGSVEDAQILAGYDREGAAVNADVGIGTVRVRGDWIASDLVAGATAGADARFGTDDDEPLFRDDAILGRIASVVIKREVLGSDNGGNHFGFVAEEIVAFKVAGNALAFTPGARNDLAGLPVGSSGEIVGREIA